MPTENQILRDTEILGQELFGDDWNSRDTLSKTELKSLEVSVKGMFAPLQFGAFKRDLPQRFLLNPETGFPIDPETGLTPMSKADKALLRGMRIFPNSAAYVGSLVGLEEASKTMLNLSKEIGQRVPLDPKIRTKFELLSGTPELYLDPDFWIINGMEMAPAIAVLATATATGVSAGAGVATSLGLGTTGRVLAKALGATIVKAPAEALVEASQIFQETFEDTGNLTLASNTATRVLTNNLALLTSSNFAEFALALAPIPLPRKLKKRGVAFGIKLLGVGALEAGQEVIQETIIPELQEFDPTLFLGPVKSLAALRNTIDDPQARDAAVLGFAFSALSTTIPAILASAEPSKVSDAEVQAAAEQLGIPLEEEEIVDLPGVEHGPAQNLADLQETAATMDILDDAVARGVADDPEILSLEIEDALFRAERQLLADEEVDFESADEGTMKAEIDRLTENGDSNGLRNYAGSMPKTERFSDLKIEAGFRADELDNGFAFSPKRDVPDIEQVFGGQEQQVPNARIQPDPLRIKGVKPKKFTEILLKVQNVTKGKLFFGKPDFSHPFGMLAGGVFDPGTLATVIRNPNDLDTASHELGHALDDSYGILSRWVAQEESPFDAELEDFLVHGSPIPEKAPNRKALQRGEGIAEWLRAWIVNPKAAEAAAPKFTEFFKSVVPEDAIKEIGVLSNDIRTWVGADAHDQISSNVRYRRDGDSYTKMVSDITRKKTVEGPGFQVTFGDKVTTRIQNAMKIWDNSLDYLMGVRGITELLPEDDPRILASALLGGYSKIDEIFSTGMRNAKNEVVLDKVTGDPVNVDFLFDPLDKTSENTLAQEAEETVSLMVAQRTVGEGNRFVSKQVKEATEKGDALIAEVEKVNDKEIGAAEKEGAKLQESARNKGRVLTEKAEKVTPFNQKRVNSANKKALKLDDVAKKKSDTLMVRAQNKATKRIELAESRATKLIEVAAAKKIPVISGIGAGIFSDTSIARKRLREIRSDPEKAKRLQEAARRYRLMAKLNLEYLRDKGRLSKEQFDRITKTGEFYVAMLRVLETSPGEEIIVFQKGRGGSLGNSIEPIKSFKGSAKMIEDPYSKLLQAVQNTVREADRNEVLIMYRNLLVGERKFYNQPQEEIASVGRLAVQGEKNTIPIYVNGQKEIWQFDPDIFKSLKGMIEGQYKLPPILTFLPQVMRASIVNSPPFAIRNVIRDTPSRIVVSRSKSGLRDIFFNRGPMDYQMLRLFGGDQAGWYGRDKADWVRAMDSSIRALATSKDTIIANPALLKNAWKRYVDVISSSERVNRLAEYRAAFRKAKKQGMDDYNANLKAAYEARKIIDFAVSGTWMQVVNQIIPFTNPAIQGMTRTLTSAREDLPGFMSRWTTYVLIPTLVIRAMVNYMGDDEELKQQPAHLRDLFWNIKIGDNFWLRIPKPYELGVFAAGVERAIDFATGDKNAFDGLGGSFFRAVVPFDEGDLAGSYGLFVQAVANKDLFRDKAIVPVHEENIDLELRNYDRASRFGKITGEAIGVDPRKIDFFMKSQFAFFGQMAAKISDVGREDRRAIGLPEPGLFVASPAYTARDVQWVFDTAGRRKLTRRKEYQKMVKLLDRYFDAKTELERDEKAAELRAFAGRVRASWEKKLPTSPGGKKKSQVERQKRLLKLIEKEQ